MAHAKITLEQLAEFMTRELPMTYDVFEKNREAGNENQQYWARGRIDAFLNLCNCWTRTERRCFAPSGNASFTAKAS